uniref:Nuclear receptor domain-containing protein n=1 Tax=Rhabditophanes sp. KR3021 TaxID=114890 RepID=A0AC35TPS2_9BILA
MPVSIPPPPTVLTNDKIISLPKNVLSPGQRSDSGISGISPKSNNSRDSKNCESEICRVCEVNICNGTHFSARTCSSCAAYFRRSISGQKTYACKKNSNCLPTISKTNGYNKICRHCRLERCYAAGMKAESVQKKRTDAIRIKATRLTEQSLTIQQARDFDRVDKSPRFLNIIKQQNEEMVIPRNLRLLKKLENYKKMSDHVQRYQEKLNKESEKALSMTKNKAKFMTRDEPVENKKSFDILENLMNFFEDMLKKQSKFSLMSPKILNVMPDCMNQKKCNSNKKLFSPTIFSFHKDGFFSLPDIMDKIFDNEREKNRWLSFVLKISGSSDALEKAIKILGPRIDEMENKIYPAINKIENMERHFQRVIKTYNFRQKRELQEHGYTFLNEKQLKMAYSGKNEQMIKAPLKDLIKLNRHQLEARIENDIRKLASYNDTKRIKRQTGTPEDPEAEGSEKHIEFITLEPFSFFNRINEPIFLEVLTLSPHAFINELNSPLLLTAEILSPRAFISAVTSPNLLLTRILSPAAFISEILSPRMLTAYILSPETFVLEILTPKMLEARIFSPEILMVQVLSPTFLSPRIVSSEALAVLILSPNIMSPNIASRETLVLEVLSPHIMGGHENTESSEEVDHDAEPHTHEPHDHHSEFHAVHIHTYPFSHKQIPHAPLGEAFHISS